MTQSPDASREIRCTRTYSASKELLFRMWSNPDHLSKWWGPTGFTTTTHQMEFQPGGIWRFTMHGPDGKDYPNRVRYISITPDALEYEHGGDGELVDFTVVVRFSEANGQTSMDFCLSFPTVEERDRVCKEFGADEGLPITMGRLDQLIATQDPKALELALVRQFSANLDTVWAAITEEEHLAKWMSPEGMGAKFSAGDFREGGQWSMTMTTPSGYEMEADGTYLEITPKSSLRYTHRWKKDDGSYKPTTEISMRLSEKNGKTTLTFSQSGFWSEEATYAHVGGWSSTLHKLAVMLGSTKADAVISTSREFQAPIDLVWRCFTEADRLASWFAPRPYTCPNCEIDLRPGGRFILVMKSPEGYEHPMHAQITDVDIHENFGWINSVPEPDGETAIQGGTWVSFEDLGASTKVTVNSYAAAWSDAGKMMIGGMEMGWKMTLDQLVEVATAG